MLDSIESDVWDDWTTGQPPTVERCSVFQPGKVTHIYGWQLQLAIHIWLQNHWKLNITHGPSTPYVYFKGMVTRSSKPWSNFPSGIGKIQKTFVTSRSWWTFENGKPDRSQWIPSTASSLSRGKFELRRDEEDRYSDKWRIGIPRMPQWACGYKNLSERVQTK